MLCRALLSIALAFSAAAAAGAETRRTDPFVFVSDRDEKGATIDQVAWWLLKSTIRPVGKSVSGVTLDRLNEALEDPMSKWCYASAFTTASFVSPSRRVQAEIDASFRAAPGPLFRASAPFTGGAMQDAVIGDYETCDGGVGGFLLITDRGQPAPAIVYFKTWPEMPGFFWIQYEKEGLILSSCFECGHVDRLYYDAPRRRFYWVSEGD